MYQVAIVTRPGGWSNQTEDDVPPMTEGTYQVAAQGEGLLEARQTAVTYNQDPARKLDSSWAVVVEAGAPSRRWPGPRLSTPVAFKLAALVRPEGWEPTSPWDVPNCIWKADTRSAQVEMGLEQVLATMRALNQQSLDLADTSWFVPVAVENEPVQETVSYDPAGKQTISQVRRVHVICPAQGTRGDCSHCPAHDFPCREAERPGPMAPEVTVTGKAK